MAEEIEKNPQFDFDRFMGAVKSAHLASDDLTDDTSQGHLLVAREMLRRESVASLEDMTFDIYGELRDSGEEHPDVVKKDALRTAESLRRRAIVAKARNLFDAELSESGINLAALGGHTTGVNFVSGAEVEGDSDLRSRIEFSITGSDAVSKLNEYFSSKNDQNIYITGDTEGSLIVAVSMDYLLERESQPKASPEMAEGEVAEITSDTRTESSEAWRMMTGPEGR